MWNERVVKPADGASGFLRNITSCMGCLRPPPKTANAGDKVTSLPAAKYKMPMLRDLQLFLQRKKIDLYSLAGEKRGRLLYETHVQQWDFVLVYANADRKTGQELRSALERSRKDVAVSGPWHIKLGDLSLSAWERLLTSTSVVVVLVSRENYSEIVKLCFMEILSDTRTTRIVPLFLEDLDESQMARELRPIRWRQEIALFLNGVDATARELARHTLPQHRYLREIMNIDNLLQRSKCLLRNCPEEVEAPGRI